MACPLGCQSLGKIERGVPLVERWEHASTRTRGKCAKLVLTYRWPARLPDWTNPYTVGIAHPEILLLFHLELEHFFKTAACLRVLHLKLTHILAEGHLLLLSVARTFATALIDGSVSVTSILYPLCILLFF